MKAMSGNNNDARRRNEGLLLFEGLLGLHRQAEGNVGGAIEHFKDLIAEQTAILASGSTARGQLDAPITGVAAGTSNVGFFHRPDICREGEWL